VYRNEKKEHNTRSVTLASGYQEINHDEKHSKEQKDLDLEEETIIVAAADGPSQPP
jgi:hypothetical protein